MDGTVNYKNGRNRSMNKALLAYHRTYDIRSNGTLELPFGPNRALLKNAPGWVSRLVERWQLGGVFSLTSGEPLNITVGTPSTTTPAVGTASWNQFTDGTPTIVGDFGKNFGKLTKLPNGVINYSSGLQQVPDPGKGGVTPLQTLQGSFSNYAIADSSGKLLLVNPAPGTNGTLGQRWVEGSRTVGFDEHGQCRQSDPCIERAHEFLGISVVNSEFRVALIKESTYGRNRCSIWRVSLATSINPAAG